VYDVELDARERPERPLPSGRISLATAATIGWGLLAAGVALVGIASALVDTWVIGFLGVFLAGAVWSYNRTHRHASTAVITMASCRFLNVILAMGVAAYSMAPLDDPRATVAERAIAGGVAFYIAGVTWFSRSEDQVSARWQLIGASVTMLLGFALYIGAPFVGHSRAALVASQPISWLVLWLAIAAIVIGRCALAVVKPQPRAVQSAVRGALRSLILIDASLVLAFCGLMWAFSVLTLVVPMLVLERWASTT
jgi:hypothetical protein